MDYYYVEGYYINAKGTKQKAKSGSIRLENVEPFARGFWASSRQEALMIATESLEGGAWIEEPIICSLSEKQRMRSIGAPELSGFETMVKRK